MTRARDVASILTAASTLSTDTETASVATSAASSAVSAHNTAANGHVGRGNTASRPGSPTNGDLYYDTDLNKLIIYSGSVWRIYESNTVPGAPTSVSGTSGSQQVALTWSAPSDNGGSSITDYVIQYSSNSGSTWSTFSDGTSTSTSATVTGLTNGTSYVFKVAASNTYGTGIYSSSSSSVTPQLALEYLVVAGGGGGGKNVGGGGGAGGYRTSSGFAFTTGFIHSHSWRRWNSITWKWCRNNK